MTLQQLHYAIIISETGSLNKAAEILYVAQPSLTLSLIHISRYQKANSHLKSEKKAHCLYRTPLSYPLIK